MKNKMNFFISFAHNSLKNERILRQNLSNVVFELRIYEGIKINIFHEKYWLYLLETFATNKKC